MRPSTKELARHLGIDLVGADVALSGVALSAGEVEPGDLFVAIQGAKHHGLDFLSEALERGAVAVLSDRAVAEVPSLVAPLPKELIGEVCDFVFPRSNLRLFAVTGTNGKTSTANYLYQLLNNLGTPTGLSGSTGFSLLHSHQETSLTTAELPTLRKFLRRLEAEGAKAAVIEVSAQALVRNRVQGLHFEVAGFTNLSRDHLDDFSSMDAYFAAKAQLFSPAFCSKVAIFGSDSWAERLANQVELPTLRVGPSQQVAYRFDAARLELAGEFELSVPFGFGDLMAKNLALALTMLYHAGFSADQLLEAAGELNQVPGRLQLVSDSLPHFYVDYAHTPDGVEKALADLQSRYPGVTILIAASGNRDQGKRIEMGRAAARAQRVILTDQHPRDEDPAIIRAAVAAGLVEQGSSFLEIADPGDAVSKAVSITPRDHAVLWCGPGHLKYREIAGRKVLFDAIAVAKMAVEGS